MSQLPIDIDAEAIYYDGHWYTRDDMARRIKAMLDQGDFAVTRPSAALEQLTGVVSSVRTLAFRSTPDMIEALNAAAARAGKSVGAFIRESLAANLGVPSADFGPAPRPADDTDPAARPPDATIRGQQMAPVVPSPSPSAPAAPIAGPGAIRAAQNDRVPSVVVDQELSADSPVELTHKKTKEEEATAERRWFNS